MNMRQSFGRALLICVTLFGIVHNAHSAFPTNQYTKTLNFTQLRTDNAFNDFKAKMTGLEDLVVTLTYNQSIAGYYGLVKVKESSGTNVYYVANTDDVTISGSTLSFSISHTNAIPNGTHNVDVLVMDTTSTNNARCGGQGKLVVRDSLFDDDDGTWQNPSFTNLVDYLTKTEAAGSYQTTNANLSTLTTPTAHRLFYSDGSSVVQELAYGTSNQVLTSQGASSAPTWTSAGSGDAVLSANQSFTGTNTFTKTILGTSSNTLAVGGTAAADMATDAEVTSATSTLHTTVSGEIDGDISTHAALTTTHGISAFGATLVDDADAATARSTLGVVAGGAGDIWVEKAGDTMSGGLTLDDGVGSSPYITLKNGSDQQGTIHMDTSQGLMIGASAASVPVALGAIGGTVVLNGNLNGGGNTISNATFTGTFNGSGNALSLTNFPAQNTPVALAAAATVTVSEASGRYYSLELDQNTTLEVSGVDTNTTSEIKLDILFGSYSLTYGATTTNLTTAGTLDRTNSWQSLILNRPIYETITEAW